MQLEGRVAVVTGAGSGIGAAAARRFAREGARVALLGRTEEKLEGVAADVREAGGEALPFATDIVEPEALREAYDRVEARWGGIDIVFANAGVNGVWAPIEELDPDDWGATIDINLTGTFQTIKFAVPHLRKRGGGSVVITASVNGTRVFSNTGATAYACSKGAQVALGRMLALELAKDRIRVNVICPGAVDTSISEHTHAENLERVRVPETVSDGAIPLTDGTPASSKQVADLVLFLVSEAASHITGTEVWIDGAQSLLKG